MSVVASSADLGQLVKQVRKASGLTQAEAAGACGVGVRFLSELENGKPSVQLDSVLAVLSGLGLQLRISNAIDDVAELPRDVTRRQAEIVHDLQQHGETLTARRVAATDVSEALMAYHAAVKQLERLSFIATIDHAAQEQATESSESSSLPSAQPAAETVTGQAEAARRSLTGL